MLNILENSLAKTNNHKIGEDISVSGSLGSIPLSMQNWLTPESVLGVVGVIIAVLSLVATFYFGRLRNRETKRANDLKEAELSAEEREIYQEIVQRRKKKRG